MVSRRSRRRPLHPRRLLGLVRFPGTKSSGPRVSRTRAYRPMQRGHRHHEIPLLRQSRAHVPLPARPRCGVRAAGLRRTGRPDRRAAVAVLGQAGTRGPGEQRGRHGQRTAGVANPSGDRLGLRRKGRAVQRTADRRMRIGQARGPCLRRRLLPQLTLRLRAAALPRRDEKGHGSLRPRSTVWWSPATLTPRRPPGFPAAPARTMARRVTVAGKPNMDVPRGTAANILRQAGLRRPSR
jgi:hypothetical protein